MNRALLSTVWPLLAGPQGRHFVLSDSTATRTRPAAPADLPLVQDFWREGGAADPRWDPAGPTPVQWEHYLQGERCATAVTTLETDPRQVIALAQVVEAGDDDGTAVLTICIAEAWQNKGLGRLLGELAHDIANDAGYPNLLAVVARHNAPMRRIMEYLGAAWEQETQRLLDLQRNGVSTEREVEAEDLWLCVDVPAVFHFPRH
jgi:RimJ/RimL family protein N-acetyltransferase